jgi:hypothetical protein
LNIYFIICFSPQNTPMANIPAVCGRLVFSKSISFTAS